MGVHGFYRSFETHGVFLTVFCFPALVYTPAICEGKDRKTCHGAEVRRQ